MNARSLEEKELDLPERPERPDCCLGGCAVCVLDGYAEEVEAWERRVAALLAEREKRATMPPAR